MTSLSGFIRESRGDAKLGADCEFVALAKTFKVPLITSDKGLLKNFPSIAISMDKFVI